MISLRNPWTGTETLVTDERLDEYLEAGFELASKSPEQKPIEPARTKPEVVEEPQKEVSAEPEVVEDPQEEESTEPEEVPQPKKAEKTKKVTKKATKGTKKK